ncbi:hypothetical protein AS005_04795 [Thermotoga sp. KOL6]|nr:hypothetical protein AS005_04795 [Thermotoga sp. KOL6]
MKIYLMVSVAFVGLLFSLIGLYVILFPSPEQEFYASSVEDLNLSNGMSEVSKEIFIVFDRSASININSNIFPPKQKDR